ncbi:MAG: CBS domain-containing protein [Verrucomicrobiae bacterium]|nr:CBS domain-containing protein [Verrucomicrobiae bacterium]
MDIRIALENETVASVGYPKPVVVQKDSTVKSAVDTMAREKTGCILIQDGETLVGIFTERDFISRVLDNRDAFGQPIKDFMTPDPLVARTDEPLYQVLSRFLQHDVRNLPVLDKKHLPVGILPVRRVVHFLADYHPTTVYNLPPDPKQMHSSPEGG